MSDVPPGGGQPYEETSYDDVSYGQPPSNARRGLRALILSLVLAVVVAGGAVAFYKADPFHLFRAGPQAAVAVPDNALFYVGADFNPAAKQKIDAVRFLDHFPGFARSVGSLNANSDLRRVIFQKAIAGQACPGLSYDHDIKPWIGDKFGVAGMPPAHTGGSPVAVVALQIISESAAKDGIHALQHCSSGGSAFGFAFVGNYVLLAETQAEATRYAAAADRTSLADNPAYSADMRSLGDLGVLSGWVDVNALVHAVGGTDAQTLGNAQLLTGKPVRVAATFRFEGGSAQLAASVYGGTEISHDPNQVVDLPDSTAFAISDAGGAQRVAASWQNILKQMRTSDSAIDENIQQFETQTGLQLPQDLETVFGKNLMLAVDGSGFTSGLLSGTSESPPSIGLRLTNDPAKLDQVYDKVLRLVQSQLGGVPLVKRDFPDGIAVASTSAYADELGKLDGNLGKTPDFLSVLPDAADDELVVYFDFNAVQDAIVQALQQSGVGQDVIDNIKPLRALGLSESVTGNYTSLSLQVSVD